MCTIMCVVGENSEEVINDIAQVQSHRGYGHDSYSLRTIKTISIASQRLAIVDIQGGKQPMSDEADEILISHSGEIYNFIELKNELKEKGHDFHTESDTELLLYAYKEWGIDCLDRLNGMFAFVIYDRRKDEIFFARDRFGIKPLHYSINNNHFLISSEAKGILASKNFPATVSNQELDFYYNSGEETRFDNINQLPPGMWGILSLSKKSKFSLETGRYHFLEDYRVFQDSNMLPEPEYAKQLYELLDASVRIHMLSDVPIGVFTSGGIDSGFIFSLASKYKKPIQAFTARVSDGKVSDEFKQAKTLTDQLQMPLELVDIFENDLIKAIPSVIYHLEDYDPRTVEIGVINYFLAKRAKELGVHVVLTGEGGDELFCGYRNFYPEFHQPKSRLSPERLQNIRLDFLKGLAGNHLLHKDRVCMAHSVEARVPFLENNLVRFALNINPSLLTKTGISSDRHLLRLAAGIEVAAGRMPESTRMAPKGYVHLELGVPNVVCKHFKVDIKGSLKYRYFLYQTIFEKIFLENRDHNEFGEEIFEDYRCLTVLGHRPNAIKLRTTH